MKTVKIPPVKIRSVNGANTVNFTYGNDGMLTMAGALSLNYNAFNGLPTGSSIGGVTDSITYNSFGERYSYAASYNGQSKFSTTYTRDALGRISQKAETVEGATNAYDYSYDTAGRLVEVLKNGSSISQYIYDDNGNRVSRITIAGIERGTYDDQDRMIAYGDATYSYNANGELLSKTDSTGMTLYNYDVLGNLVSVNLPNGTLIEYVIDGNNRRIGKKVDGALVKGFIYKDSLNPIAELDGQGNVVSRFVYASKGNVPDFMIKNGTTYRIISDHLGSPRLVIDVATGNVAQKLEYDVFGNVTTDTAYGFQPFGFAGGLYDRDTSLTRFGARDYDPVAGRWTSKDPIRFSGRDTNLYGYVLNDPVNLYDLNGLAPIRPRRSEDGCPANSNCMDPGPVNIPDGANPWDNFSPLPVGPDPSPTPWLPPVGWPIPPFNDPEPSEEIPGGGVGSINCPLPMMAP